MDSTIKKYEDLLRRYNILNSISKIVASTRELNKILGITLKGVTFGNGFGFNRAMLFLIDERTNTLKGKLAIGTETAEEAWKIWADILQKNYSLEEFLSLDKLEDEKSSTLNQKILCTSIPIKKNGIIEQCLDDGNPKNVDLTLNGFTDKEFIIKDASVIEKEIMDLVNHPKFCMIPLICRTKKVGIIIVDNKYNNREISREDCIFLMMLGQFAASSIRNTIIYDELKESLNKLANVNYQIKLLKEYNENILESIPLNVFVVDKDFYITACNKNFSELIHLPKSEIIGENIRNYNVKISGYDLIEEVEHVLTNKDIKVFKNVKIELFNKMSESTFDFTLVTLKNSKENIDGVIGILEDITKTVNLEKLLEEAKRFSELGKLSAAIAHEIKNPLISIGGYANRIKRKYFQDNEFDISNIEVVINEISRLEKILDDILYYGSEKKIIYEHMNLSLLIKDCIKMARVSAQLHNISITLISEENYLDNEDLIIHGSYNNLKQAFINLLNNAIEASTSRQKISIDSKIVAEDNKNFIEIKINNEAIIQNEKDINNIFTPFYTTKIHGTGLGLPITKKIIEQHHGSISVESNFENGTTFSVKLPLLSENGHMDA
ncbi:MAG: ATP-binding protein [Actinomycetota bacterium]|nr:ATP-binding protein [Actinomycetota bacterium]